MHIIRPLRKPAAALLWAGLSLSALGDPLYAVALTWIAVGVLGSGAGDLAALNAGVVLLATLGLGRWADGWDQRRSMVAADLVRAAALPAGTSSRRRPSRAMIAYEAVTCLPVVLIRSESAVFQPGLT